LLRQAHKRRLFPLGQRGKGATANFRVILN
jgi:hypothetical protein